MKKKRTDTLLRQHRHEVERLAFEVETNKRLREENEKREQEQSYIDQARSWIQVVNDNMMSNSTHKIKHF